MNIPTILQAATTAPVRRAHPGPRWTQRHRTRVAALVVCTLLAIQNPLSAQFPIPTTPSQPNPGPPPFEAQADPQNCEDWADRIAELSQARDSLLLRYTERHPDVLKLDRRIAEMEALGGRGGVRCSGRGESAQRRGTRDDPEALRSFLVERPRLPGARGIDNAGYLTVARRPHLPLGLYAVPLDALPRAKALGFDTVHTYRGESDPTRQNFASSDQMRRYLDAAAGLGLKVLVGLPRYQVTHRQYQALDDRVRTLANHRALLAWYLYDEPDCGRVPPATIARLTEGIGRFDKSHPRVLALCRDGPSEYQRIPDVLMQYSYPIRKPGSATDPVWRSVSAAMKAARPGQTVWSVIQMHGRGPGGKGYGRREPNGDELRNMAFLALVAGARGLMFYEYHGSEFHLHRSPDGMANAHRVVSEIRRVMPILLAGRRARIPGLALAQNPHLRTAFYALDGDAHILAVNSARQAEMLVLDFAPWAKPKRILERFEDRSLAPSSNRLVAYLPPLGVRLYTLEYSTSGSRPLSTPSSQTYNSAGSK